MLLSACCAFEDVGDYQCKDMVLYSRAFFSFRQLCRCSFPCPHFVLTEPHSILSPSSTCRCSRCIDVEGSRLQNALHVIVILIPSHSNVFSPRAAPAKSAAIFSPTVCLVMFSDDGVDFELALLFGNERHQLQRRLIRSIGP